MKANILITPTEMEANVSRRFDKFQKQLVKEIGSTLDKKDMPIFKWLFRNGYIACLKDFSQGRIPVELSAEEEPLKS